MISVPIEGIVMLVLICIPIALLSFVRCSDRPVIEPECVREGLKSGPLEEMTPAEFLYLTERKQCYVIADFCNSVMSARYVFPLLQPEGVNDETLYIKMKKYNGLLYVTYYNDKIRQLGWMADERTDESERFPLHTQDMYWMGQLLHEVRQQFLYSMAVLRSE
jgi:hypothetical protein